MTRRKVKEADRAALRALSDEALDTLLAIIHIVGTRRQWPQWAHAALGQTEPDARTRRAFRRLLRRVWERTANWQTRDAMCVLAGALGVPLPAPSPAPVQRVRTRWAGHAPSTDADRSPSTNYVDAGGTPDAPPAGQEPAAAADAETQERMRRHNNQPGVWQPAPSLSDAIHDEERGWW